MSAYKFLAGLQPLIEANLTLEMAIQQLAKQSLFAEQSKITLSLIKTGHAFSTALFVQNFPGQIVTFIKVGEKTGNLNQAIKNAIEHENFKQSIKKIISGTLRYPICVMLMTVITLLILQQTMMPNFKKMFASQNKPLPELTQLVFNHAELGIILILLMSTCVFICFLPIFKLHKLIQFCSNFHTKLSAGLTILDASDQNLACFLKQGYPLSIALTIEQYPTLLIYMIQAGEATGNLEDAFKRASLFYQNKLLSRCDKLKSILPGVLILFLSGVVGLVVVAMYLPLVTVLN